MEHLEFYSLGSLEYLLDRHDMEVVDVSLNDINGGSFRVYVRNYGAQTTLFGDEQYRRQAFDRVRQLRESEKLDGLEYVIIRGENSGVFAGYLESRNNQEVVLRNARRIWYWDGANSLSQLAEDGTSKPENCKFPCEVKKIQILDAIEVINCSEKAQKAFKA